MFARRRLIVPCAAVLALSASPLIAGTAANAQPASELEHVTSQADRVGRGRSDEAPPLPSVRSAVTFAGGPRYETASDGTVYSPLDEPPFILGHDNGQSTLYDDGHGLRFSYWSFGDTLLSEPNGEGKNFLGNTGARTFDLKMSDNVSTWEYDGDVQGPREPWRLNETELEWNRQHKDTDPDTPGCQPAPGIDWMSCGDEYAIWGGGIVADPKHRRILSFYSLAMRYHIPAEERPDPENPGQMIPCTDEDFANRVEECRIYTFRGAGVGVAVWTQTPADGDGWERKDIRNATDPSNLTALWPFDDDPSTADKAYNNAIFAHGGYIYAYGCPGFLATECELARVSLAKPEWVWDRAAWRFYAGRDRDRARCPHLWSADIDCAVPLTVDTDGGPPESMGGGAAGSSIFWNPALRVFMFLYSQPLSNEIRYRVAYRPEGPWSRSALLGMALPSVGTGLGSISYAGFAHPEYAEKNGLVQYITYAHTTGFLRSDLPILKVTFDKR